MVLAGRSAILDGTCQQKEEQPLFKQKVNSVVAGLKARLTRGNKSETTAPGGSAQEASDGKGSSSSGHGHASEKDRRSKQVRHPRRRREGRRQAAAVSLADLDHHQRSAHKRPRGASVPPHPGSDILARLARDSDFRKLDVHDRILAAVAELGFTACTPIQAQALPHSLAGKDVAGKAQTGTGKTAAFLITIIQQYLKAGAPRNSTAPMALVLAPTRELAIQIDKDAAELGKHSGIRHLVVYGGTDYQKQQDQLQEGVDLLTATPGRLIDYLRQRKVSLSEVEVLIIDEADRMLDMGFIPDVRRIVAKLPAAEQRQTLLFSATLSGDIMRLAERWMRDPVQVEIEAEQMVADKVEQILYAVAARDKLALLLWLLNNEAGERVLVFRNRRDSCDRLVRELMRYGVNCALLSGDVPQKKRTKVLEAFRQGRIRVIVATDVAGRGIHVENISHVVNYDLPYEPEDYVHRIGRTGRAGVEGRAVSFACEEGAFVLPDIEAFIETPLASTQPAAEMLKLPHPVNPRAGKVGSGRPPRPRSGSGRSRSGGRSRGDGRRP
jgi:ATP-dependent RNA helicase RhlB